MLSGDLSTMALADVLQWVDAQRNRARITVTGPDGQPTWLLAEGRMVIATKPPFAHGKLATDGSPANPGPGLRALALEQLLDLFLTVTGRFELVLDVPTPEPHVATESPIQFLVMEALRQLDEWPRILETYPHDEARLGTTDRAPDRLTPVQEAIYTLAEDAPSLAQARLVLGLSRPALLRRVDEMRQRGLVEVEGSPHGPDLGTTLISQARVLLREHQYREAAHVFRSLVASDPGDDRARRWLDEAERLQREDLYLRTRRTDVVARAGDAEGRSLSAEELAVLAQLDRPRSVAVLVLVSPLRELETLYALHRLEGRGLVTVEAAD